MIELSDLNIFTEKVLIGLKNLHINTIEDVRQYDACYLFLLLKKQGLTLTRSTLWQLVSVQRSISPLDLSENDKQYLLKTLKNHPPVAIFPSQKTMLFFMQEAINEAKKALLQQEVPIGAIVVKDNKIIGRGFNRCVQNHYIAEHAEMCAIKEASLLMNNYRLDECDLYVTVEPCIMCAGAIIQSRIQRLIFATTEPKTGAAGSQYDVFSHTQLNKHTAVYRKGILATESQMLLKQFFQQKRAPF